ncbi:MAG: response regulator, partial [Deltaproteobacteria bacterium]|nr:response regulator [Deltaproteobacteria bacterium]
MDASVLVADSDENLRELLKHVLEGAGYAVVSVADSVEAHKCLEQVEFDVIVCDVLLQGPSGARFLTEVKQQMPQSEVIATTAHATLDAAIESLRAGVFDFLQKPFKALEVLSTVSRALERRNLLTATALYKACQVIFDTRDPVQLPERVVRVAADIMRADSVALQLQSPEGALHIAYSVGIKPGRAAENLQSLGQWIAQSEGDNRSPKLLPEDLGQDSCFVGVRAAVGDQSVIAFPLLSGDRMIGILFLGREPSSKAFRKNDMELVAVLASQVVLALENVRLLHQIVLTERLATIGQFAASVAHDIRNPLTYVHGNLMLITELFEDISRSEAGLPPGFEKILSAIAEALVGADFITDLVSDIGKLARTNEQDLLSCDLNEAVRSAIRISGTTVRKKAE